MGFQLIFAVWSAREPEAIAVKRREALHGDPHYRSNTRPLNLHLGALSFDAVKHLLLCHIERRPPRLDLDCYPHLPLAQVATTVATDYLSLPITCRY